jgi:hypothetical protein
MQVETDAAHGFADSVERFEAHAKVFDMKDDVGAVVVGH